MTWRGEYLWVAQLPAGDPDISYRLCATDARGNMRCTPVLSLGDLPPVNAILLGEQDGVAWFAVLMPAEEGEELPPSRAWGPPELTDEPQWLDLRQAGATLDDTSAGLFTTAAALFQYASTFEARTFTTASCTSAR